MISVSFTLTPISTVNTEAVDGTRFNVFEDVTIDDGGAGVNFVLLGITPQAGAPLANLFFPTFFGGFFFDGVGYRVTNSLTPDQADNGSIVIAATGERIADFEFEGGFLSFDAVTTLSNDFVEFFLESLVIETSPFSDYAYFFTGVVATASASADLIITNDAPELAATLSTDVRSTDVAMPIFETAELSDNDGVILSSLQITSSVAGDSLTFADRIPWREGFLVRDGSTLRDEATGFVVFDFVGEGTSEVTLTARETQISPDPADTLAVGAVILTRVGDAGSGVLQGIQLTPDSAGDRTLTVTVTDTRNDVGVFDFTVTSNSVPTLTGLPTELFGLTQVTAPLDLATIDIEDDDPTEILTLTFTPEERGFASATSGGGVTVATNSMLVRSSVSLTGTADALDAFLDAGGVSFRPFTSSDTDLGTIAVTLSDGAFTVDAGTIAIIASDTPPAFSSPRSFEVREGVLTIADLSSVDNADTEGAGLVYTIDTATTDADVFDIDPVTGLLSFSTARDFEAPTDFDGDNRYFVGIRVTDSSGLFAQPLFSVTVLDDLAPVAEDDAIALFNSQTREIDVLENDSDGEGPVTFASLDLTETQGAVTDLGNGLLRYDPGTAFAGLAVDATATDSFVYTIRDSNGETATGVVNVTISGAPPNLPPTLALTPVLLSLPEDTDLSTRVKVADVVVTDDGIGTNDLSLGGADAAAFELDGMEVFLRSGTTLDFETDPSLAVTVSVDDPIIGSGPEASADLTVAVTDVNEAPVLSLADVLDTLSEATDTTARIRIADIVVTDDALGTNTLGLTGADAGLFEIAGSELFLAAGSLLDFETDPQLDVTVTLDDPAFTGLEGSEGIVLAITDANDPPQLGLVNVVSQLAEDTDSSVRIKIADIVITDDALGTNTLSLSGRDAGLFQIDGSQLFLRAGTTLDSAVLAQLQVSVLVDDPATGATPDDTVTFSVDILEVTIPPVVEDDTPQVPEDDTDTNAPPVPEDDTETNAPPVARDDMLSSAAFTPVFAFDPTANDTDPDGDPLSVGALTASGPGFSFETPTGTGLLTAAGGILVRNADGSLAYAAPVTFTGLDSFTYEVEDPSGATDTGMVTIQVLDSGLGANDLQARSVAYLYEAAFDRLADLPGLNFWIDALFNELPEQSRAFTVVDIAEFFLASEEFEGRIGGSLDTLTDQAFVELIYRNVLDRDGDADGIAFWVNALGTPEFDRDDLLAAFAVSPENQLGAPEITALVELSPGEWGFV